MGPTGVFNMEIMSSCNIRDFELSSHAANARRCCLSFGAFKVRDANGSLQKPGAPIWWYGILWRFPKIRCPNVDPKKVGLLF